MIRSGPLYPAAFSGRIFGADVDISPVDTIKPSIRRGEALSY